MMENEDDRATVARLSLEGDEGRENLRLLSCFCLLVIFLTQRCDAMRCEAHPKYPRAGVLFCWMKMGYTKMFGLYYTLRCDVCYGVGVCSYRVVVGRFLQSLLILMLAQPCSGLLRLLYPEALTHCWEFSSVAVSCSRNQRCQRASVVSDTVQSVYLQEEKYQEKPTALQSCIPVVVNFLSLSLCVCVSV